MWSPLSPLLLRSV
ncbi:hypothetical protein F383_28486 [Gossypium arboreum]|uniref:Uncharacterized protein n=1 Tax=Gossypium arboreum TaxID=29729 RepID=A0A0B0N0J8_GOSAR|nr:hypothetical protein F383_28486 [Gossypium arboreum]